MPGPAFVVHHRRTGVAALNVVTAALDVDARTADTDVVFASTRADMITALRDACARDGRAVAGWSFYSTDFAMTAEELAAVRAATEGLDILHVAGGAHATACPSRRLPRVSIWSPSAKARRPSSRCSRPFVRARTRVACAVRPIATRRGAS